MVAATHPLARKSTLAPKDLRDFPLIASSNAARAESRGLFARIFGPVTPKLQIIRLPLTDAIVDMARAGMGIAVLSEWVASGYLAAGDLVVKRLASGPVLRPWRIAYRREVEHAAELLAAALDGAPPRLLTTRRASPRSDPRRSPTRAS